MNVLNYLPSFKIVEINRSTGLVAGHLLSNFPYEGLAGTTTGEVDFLENGIIVALDKDLTLTDFDVTAHDQPFLVFTEELVTFLPGLKYFATEEDPDGDIYPRAIGLYVGDSFTTNNYAGEWNDELYAKVVNGVLTFTSVEADAIFAVEESSLPSGVEGMKFTYLGLPVA